MPDKNDNSTNNDNYYEITVKKKWNGFRCAIFEKH